MKDRTTRTLQKDGLYAKVTENTFKERSDSNDPWESFKVVTPSDTTNLRPSLGAMISISFTGMLTMVTHEIDIDEAH